MPEAKKITLSHLFPVNMNLRQFYLVGINYKKSDATIRGLFAINDSNNKVLVEAALKAGVKEIMVLSTCNRTEVYAIANSASQLLDLIASHTNGNRVLLESKSYVKKNEEAIRHLFRVGAGLDSQILGDYEIIGQLKNAFRISKEVKGIGTHLERLFNTVLQASKEIKNTTELSSGTVSVSFAVVQYILQQVSDAASKKFLLIGAGKIGTNTCKNIIDYIHPKQLSIMNRTDEKAIAVSASLQIDTLPYAQLEAAVQEYDIIVVATHSNDYVIKASQLGNASGKKYFIDLSIPNNIEPAIAAGVHELVNVDDLSRINDATLQKRRAQVPMALEIIARHMEEFQAWLKLRKYAPVLHSLKNNLLAIDTCLTADKHQQQELINKIVNRTASHIRNNTQPHCFYMKAVQDFIAHHNRVHNRAS